MPGMGDISRLLELRQIMQALSPDKLFSDIRQQFPKVLASAQISAAQKSALEEWLSDQTDGLELYVGFQLGVLESTLKGEEPEDLFLKLKKPL